jgi:hypothetical protein
MWSAKRSRTALLCFTVLFESFASAFFQGVAQNKSQEVTRHLLFVVRERVPLISSLNCPLGRVVYGISYSVITVFADGKGTNVVWSVPPCSDPARASDWTAPADGKAQNFALSQSTLAQLRNCLDRPEVAQLRDFMNAGGGVGDYEIEIHRASGVQQTLVMSLMPEHDELKRDPTLLQLICKAKEIAGDERPRWCPNPPQAKPVGAQ